MGAIDVRLGQVELAAIAEILGELAENSLERLVRDPRLESPMARLIRRVSARHVCPRRARSEHPQHAVDDRPRFLPGSAALLGRALELLGGETAFDRFPLLIGEVHLQP